MRYQVPQFLEVEDKVFGPLTLKQFLYVAGGSAIGFILWSFLPRILSVFIGVPLVGFFFMLAFYKVNGRPMSLMVESMMKYGISPRLYIWKKKEKSPEKKKKEKEDASSVYVPRLSDSKLKDLSWELDVHEKIGGKTPPLKDLEI